MVLALRWPLWLIGKVEQKKNASVNVVGDRDQMINSTLDHGVNQRVGHLITMPGPLYSSLACFLYVPADAGLLLDLTLETPLIRDFRAPTVKFGKAAVVRHVRARSIQVHARKSSTLSIYPSAKSSHVTLKTAHRHHTCGSQFMSRFS